MKLTTASICELHVQRIYTPILPVKCSIARTAMPRKCPFFWSDNAPLQPLPGMNSLTPRVLEIRGLEVAEAILVHYVQFAHGIPHINT